MNRRDFLKTLLITTPVKKIKRVIKTPAKNTINAVKSYQNVVQTVNKNGLEKYSRKEFLDNSKLKSVELAVRNRFNMFSEKQNFLSDAEFSIPSTGFGKTLKKIGDSVPGKLFFKDARIVKHYDKAGKILKNTNGIAESGKSLRTSPFLAAGGLGVAYGGYRAKKTYDKYKPEIDMGRTAMKKYNQFKNMFNKENN